MDAQRSAAEDFVEGILAEVKRFGRAKHIAHPVVELELRDATRYRVDSLTVGPGADFVTVAVHPEHEMPTEIIVPLGVIVRIELFERDEPERGFGFSAG